MNSDYVFSRRAFLGAAALVGIQAALMPYEAWANPLGEWKANEETPADSEVPQDGRVWVDSAGREVLLPNEICKVSPTGSYGQAVLGSISLTLLASLAADEVDLVSGWLDADLPRTGCLYAGVGSTVDCDALRAAAPDVIIDMGELKETTISDMDKLQEETGIPVVFICSDEVRLFKAYEALGDLLGNGRAYELGEYAHDVALYARAAAAEVAMTDRYSVCVVKNAEGVATFDDDAFLGGIVEMAGAVNCALGDEGEKRSVVIDTESLLSWDPDVIVMSSRECYENYLREDSLSDVAWGLSEAGRYDRVLPGCVGGDVWLDGFSPLSKQLVGTLWLGNALYPDVFKFDMKQVLDEYRALFFDVPTTSSAIPFSAFDEGASLTRLPTKAEIAAQRARSESEAAEVVAQMDAFQEERRAARERGEE